MGFRPHGLSPIPANIPFLNLIRTIRSVNRNYRIVRKPIHFRTVLLLQRIESKQAIIRLFSFEVVLGVYSIN